MELHLSHWSGDLPEFVVKVDWVYKQLRPPLRLAQVQGQGRLRLQGDEVRLPARHLGPERHGRHLQLTLRPRLEARERLPDAPWSGAFCYGFYPHGNRPVGKGREYRATVMGPGVTPILFWQGAAPGPFDPQLDEIAIEEQQQLFTNAKCRHR